MSKYFEYPELSVTSNLYGGFPLHSLAKKYNTPLIVYSMKRLSNNISRLREAFVNSPVKIHYAVKANYNPYIVSRIINSGAGIDAANLNEVKLALQLGARVQDIIATPNNLSADELLEISKLNVTINFDHGGQMELIKNNLPETVSFRINPGIGKGEFAGITTAGHNVKFGIPPEDAIEAYRRARKYGAQKFGIHMMTGSNVLEPEFFRESTDRFFSIASEICDSLGIEFSFLDVGGGFGVPYNSYNDPLDIVKTAGYIKENFSRYRGNGYFKSSELIIEPGRYIIADAAILLSEITSIKNSDHRIMGLDTGMNTMIRIPLYGAHHDIKIAGYDESEYGTMFDVVGQVCENTDYLVHNILLPDAHTGDLALILNAGAYVSSMASNYNLLGTPAEVAIDEGIDKLIRTNSTLDTMLAGFLKSTSWNSGN
jgi:diaminopimelate decarboxylase